MRDPCPGIDAKAAVLLESLVRNHALVDGTTRLGWLATVVFYGPNGIRLGAPDDDAYSRDRHRQRNSQLLGQQCHTPTLEFSLNQPVEGATMTLRPSDRK